MNQNSQNSMMPPNQNQTQQQYNQASQEAQMAQYNSMVNAWMTYGYTYNMPVAGNMGMNYMQYPQAYGQGYPTGYPGQAMNSTGIASYAAQPGLFPSANPPLPPGNAPGQAQPPLPPLPPPPPPKPSEPGEPTIMKGPKMLLDDIQDALIMRRRSPLPFLEPPPMPPTFPYLAISSFSLLNDDIEILPNSCPTPICDTPPARGTPYVPVRHSVPVEGTPLHPLHAPEQTSTQSAAPVSTEDHWHSIGINPSSIHPSILQHITPLTCGICKIALNGDGMAYDHYRGKRHAKNVELWLESNPQGSSRGGTSSLTGSNAIPLGQAPKPLMDLYCTPRPRPNSAPAQQHKSSRPTVPPNIRRNDIQNGNNKSAPKAAAGTPIKQRNSSGGGTPHQNVPAKKMNNGGPGPRDSKSVPQVIPNQYDYCGLCNAPLGSKNSADQHYAGKRHKEAMAKQNTRTC